MRIIVRTKNMSIKRFLSLDTNAGVGSLGIRSLCRQTVPVAVAGVEDALAYVIAKEHVGGYGDRRSVSR
jgi:16S rRNA G966 N2-methylase RsmD